MIVALSRAAAFTGAALILGYGMIFTESHGSGVWLVLMLIAALLLLYALVPRLSRSIPRVNQTIVVAGSVFVVGFLILTVQLVRIQVVESADVANRSETASQGNVVSNPRHNLEGANVDRGDILSRDGAIVAETVPREDGSFERIYPNDHLAFLAGYYSPRAYGSSGLEAEYENELMGREGGNPFVEWMDDVLHRTTEGYDLRLTVDNELQRRAYELLGDQSGAVILMDAETGAVYSMVGKPNIDPNRLYTSFGPSSDEEIADAAEYWEQVVESENSPLVARPTQGLYAPGSIFKTITAAAALRNDIAEPDTVYRDEGVISVGNGSRVIIEQNLPDEDRVSYSLSESYGYSLNVVFAQVGIQLGPERLSEMAERFGFGEAIPFDVPVTPSQIANDEEYLNDEAGLAETAFGQGQLFVTPMQMALMTQAVANGGEMAEPFLVEQILDSEGEVLRTFGSSTWREPISEENAAALEQMMIESVEFGYATNARIPGVIVGGKTGTAEVGEQTPHAWFVGFAGPDEPRYVVAVVVENGGSGSSVALPIGREMLRSAMERLD